MDKEERKIYVSLLAIMVSTIVAMFGFSFIALHI